MKEVFPYTKTGVCYLDSAASTQKPVSVLAATQTFYEEQYSNVHRGLHRLAEAATIAYEKARQAVAKHIHAKTNEIVFTSGTTDSMNLLATTYPLTKNDVVVLTELEHHSTLVPWQQAAKRAGATLKYIPITKDHELDMQQAKNIISQGCSVLAVVHVSNVTGTMQEIKQLAEWVHEQNGVCIVDGAQAIPHITVDVKTLGCDAYAFSGHKAYGPTGIGVVYIQEDLAQKLPPYRFGGEMVNQVTKQETTFQNPPMRFEAGTPPIAQAVGLQAALEFLEGIQDVQQEQELVDTLYDELSKREYINIIGPKKRKALVSFTVKGVHAHDVAQFLDTKGIAVRAGHHCTQVLHDTLGIPASVRASIGVYNTEEDVQQFLAALDACKEAFNV